MIYSDRNKHQWIFTAVTMHWKEIFYSKYFTQNILHKTNIVYSRHFTAAVF